MITNEIVMNIHQCLPERNDDMSEKRKHHSMPLNYAGLRSCTFARGKIIKFNWEILIWHPNEPSSASLMIDEWFLRCDCSALAAADRKVKKMERKCSSHDRLGRWVALGIAVCMNYSWIAKTEPLADCSEAFLKAAGKVTGFVFGLPTQ